MTPPPQIQEAFSVCGERIVRSLTVGGLSGASAVRISDRQRADVAEECLSSVWDKTYLLGRMPPAPLISRRTAVRVADVFCGAGGLSFGVFDAVRACGLEPRSVLAVDVSRTALEVYRRNFDPEGYSAENLWTSVTTNYSTRGPRIAFSSAPALLSEPLAAAHGKVDLLLGGPPCEGHSTSNNRTRRSDPRNMYYVVMPALAVALGAKAVIVENVPGIRHDSRGILEQAKGLFASSGYLVDEFVVDAVRVGLPQTRKRHILLASCGHQPDVRAAVARVARPQRPLRWAIEDLMHVDSHDLFDTPATLSDVNKRRIDYLFDHGEYDLPNEHRPDSHKDGHTYPSIYGRLRWDKPAGTITTGFNTPGRGRYVHPERRTTITPHEAARIQGFPDCFEFRLIDGRAPTRTDLAAMIGDAVPPQIGYAAGLAALASLADDLVDRGTAR